MYLSLFFSLHHLQMNFMDFLSVLLDHKFDIKRHKMLILSTKIASGQNEKCVLTLVLFHFDKVKVTGRKV